MDARRVEDERTTLDQERAVRQDDHLKTMGQIRMLELQEKASEERFRATELSVQVQSKKEQLSEQQKLVSQCSDEVSRLQLVSALGSDMKRCYRCDMNLANLQPLLRANQQICEAVL